MRMLIIEDDKSFSDILYEFFSTKNFKIDTAENGKEAFEKLKNSNYDVVLLDLLLPDINGMDILRKIKESSGITEVIVITGHGNIKLAVQAIKMGAYDFLTKPCSLSEIEITVRKAVESVSLKKENELYKKEKSITNYEELIFESPKMKEIVEKVERISCSDCPVLITGETGTGKEVIARLIHKKSDRSEKPFIALNVSAIPKDLVEAELFGYEKGAFTGATTSKEGFFELADKGTLFLDEIGELEQSIQSKLLRILETKKFFRVGGRKEIETDVRIIAATNRNLEKLVEEGKFREDLYYRLNVIEIRIPPLRERKEDIIPLAEYFLRIYSSKYSKELQGFSEEAKDILLSYPWYGNVRELKNVIERAVIFAEGNFITEKELSCLIREKERKASKKIDEIEKEAIIEVLKKTNYNKKKAAEILGIPLRTFYRKLKKYDIT